MKKIRLLLLVAVITLISAFTMFACGSNDSPKAIFTQNEFVLSLNETINFFDYLKFENVEREKVEIKFSNEELFIKNDNGTYSASKSGKGLVRVEYQQNLLASCNVVVKQKFTTPDGVVVDDKGVISWNESTAYDDTLLTASTYIIKIDGEERTIQGNTLTLDHRGVYNVQVKACGSGSIDESDFSEVFRLNYGVMEEVKITEFNVSTIFGSQEAQFVWEPIALANYNIYLDGFKIGSKISGDRFTLNFANFYEGQRVDVVIEAVDITDNLLPSKKTISVQKIGRPNLSYSFDGRQGKAVWTGGENATSYTIQCLDRNNPSSVTSLTVKAGELESTLEGLDGGIYTISVQANGGYNENGYFVNSNSTSQEFAKIPTPVISHSIENGILKIELPQDGYVEDYLITYGDHSINWNINQQGRVASVNVADFAKGKHEVCISALPATNNEEVKDLAIGGFVSNRVVNSNVVTIDVYLLDDITGAMHVLVDGESILSFDKVEYATSYTVTVGGQVFTQFTEKDNTITFNLGNLSVIPPVGGEYQFTIKADRIENNTIASTAEKTLTILGKTSGSTEQENGYYSWSEIQGDVEYRYDIYEVDKNFTLGESVSSGAIVSEITSSTKTIDELGYGYYYIRVYSISTNNDKYLSSDFYDKNGYYQALFFVEDQIATPTAEFGFNETTGTYYLTINKVNFAERYDIEVNGKADGVLFDSNPALNTLVYNFTNKFNGAGVYNISLKASAGTAYDGQLHTPSEEYTFNVNKLVSPTFEVDEKELLSIVMNENATSVVIMKGETLLNPDDKTSISLAEINGQFDLVMKFVAKEAEEGIYYIDSNEIVYHFKRTSQPTNIAFTSGILSFDCEDETYVEKYIGTLTLVNQNNGNYTINFDIDSTSFNLQSFIQEKILEDIRFESAYKQCTSIEVMVSAYKLGAVTISGREIFYLPSTNGTTAIGGDRLSLTQLQAPTITFNTSTQTLSWNGVGTIGQTTYSIYVDDKLIRDNLAGTSFSLRGLINFDEVRSVFVFANNPSYLSSANSNEISIVKLQTPSSVGVLNDNTTIYFTIPSVDLAHVAGVQCNDKSIAFNSTNGYVSIDLVDFMNDNKANLTLAVLASEAYTSGGITYYYLDSDISEYEFVNIEDTAITLDLEDGVLEWNDIATDFVGITERPLSYTLNITENGTIVEKIPGLKTNKYSLDAEILYKLLVGKYQLQVEAMIENYNLVSGSNGGKGYFGYTASNVLNVVKLDAVQAITFESVEDGAVIKLTERKASAKVKFSWTDIWQDMTNVSFNIHINETKLENIKAGDIDQNYTFILENGIYELVLSNTYFKSGINNISIVVNADVAITSNVYSYEILRYNTINSLEISDDGILSINADSDIDSFLIGVLIGGNMYYTTTQDREFNIMDGLLDKASGNYTVEVVGFDSKGGAISSMRATTINGYRLNGISDISILENGNVSISLYTEAEIDENITFVARRNNSILYFTPIRVGNSSVFTYSMIEFIELFNITSEGMVDLKISVQKTGNINADWIDLSFNYVLEQSNSINYARGRDYADDYLILSYIEGTSAFRFELNYTITGSILPITVLHTYTAQDLRGFWITTESGQEYFVKEKPAVGITDSRECFGISLNELLSDVNGGSIQIKISRVQKLGEEEVEFYQYNIVDFSCVKLDPVSAGARISNNRVTWNASTVPDTEYYVYFYTLNDGEYKLNFYRHVTTAYIDIYDEISAGVRYYINVVSVSPTLRKIASNPTSNVEAFKYLAPTAIEIVDGRIMFNRELIQTSDLFASIETNFNLTNVTPNDIVRNIASASYDDIYTFTASAIASMMVDLNFHSLTNGRNYVVRLNAIDLMPDISQYSFETNQGTYINYLQALYDAARQATAQYTYRLEVEGMFNALKNANGVADYEKLFDAFGGVVPSDDYEVSLSQVGVDSMGTISSHPSNVVDVHVGSAPNISLACESSSGRNEYKVSFTPTMVKTKEGDGITSAIAQTYTMYMVSTDKLSQYFFTIINSGTITDPIYEIINVITPNSDEYGKISYVATTFDTPIRLDYSNGRVVISLTNKLLPAMPSIERKTYDFTIFAHGNDFTINSKTDMVSITFLGIDYTNISLNKGVLTWSASGSADYKTRVTYRKEGEGVSYIDVPFVEGQASLDMLSQGVYQYVIISILGREGTNSLIVDSESYLIENVYKLLQPTISTKGNQFTITNQSRNRNYYSYTQYEITNDVALASSEVISPYLTNLSSNMEYTYFAGLLGMQQTHSDYRYKATEQNASEYFISTIGNSSEFIASDRLSDSDTYYSIADFILVPNSEINYCVLSSNEVSVKAKMLKSPENLKVENGDIVWAESADATAGTLPANAKIAYEVNVHYYKQKDDGSAEIIGSTAIFYTQNTNFDTINIVARDDAEYYIFEIRALAFINGNSNDYNVQTIEGTYLKYSSLEYVDGGGILGSEFATLGNHINTISKIPAIINPKISGGEFTWQTATANNGFECVVIDKNGKVVSGQIYGQGTTEWKFIPDLTYENNPYSFRVYVYNRLTDTLKSNAVEVTLGGSNEVRMLPVVTSDYFVIEKIDNGYQVNLEKLYTGKQIYDTDVYYNVKMIVTISYADGRTVSVEANSFDSQSNSNRNFILANDEEFSVNGSIVNLPKTYKMLSIKFQVVVRNQSSQSIMLLNGRESEIFELTPLGWKEGDTVTWNEEAYRFEWTFANASQETDAVPLFNIDIEYSDGTHEQCDVSGYSYEPRKVGNIVSAKLLVRKDANSLYSVSAKEAIGISKDNPVRFWLFNGGNGSKESPYLIASAEQFGNMKYRNSSTEIYYFRQTATLEIATEGFAFDDTFYGVYDANGFTISFTVEATEVSAIRQSLFANTTSGVTSVDFVMAGALFRGLGANSEISNLKLELNFVSTQTSKNTLFAGLTLTSYGNLQNIEILSINSQYSFGRVSNIALAQCGLVATNYGRLTDCINSANVTMAATASYAYNFIVAGLVFTNDTSGNNFTGTLTRCFNRGNITASASRGNSTLWLSGIVLNNVGGKLVECGNDGAVASGDTGATGNTSYIAGIALRSVDGEITYTYNNGGIKPATKDTSYIAGIAYSLSGGRISALVETSRNYIARVCVNNVRNVLSSYCYTDCFTSGITITAIKTDIMSCGDGYSLVIAPKDEGFIASIS